METVKAFAAYISTAGRLPKGAGQRCKTFRTQWLCDLVSCSMPELGRTSKLLTLLDIVERLKRANRLQYSSGFEVSK